MGKANLFNQILLVEDDPSHAHLIKRVLSDYCNSVEVGQNVQASLELLDSTQPDLIVTDLHLPDSTGLNHIEKLISKAPQLSVIVLTSSASLSDAVSAMQLGAKDFIVKNFDDNFREVVGLSLSRVYAAELLEAEQRKLRAEMEALRMAIEGSQDGLAVCSLDGDVLYSNKAFSGLVSSFGGTSEHISKIFSENVFKSEAVSQNLSKNMVEMSAGSVWSSEIVMVENKEQAFDLSLYRMASPNGNPAVGLEQVGLEQVSPEQTLSVIWIRDISERKRREKFQREIISTTTHDLKGPLATISLCAEMLLDWDEESDRSKELVKRVASSAQGAINMIETFLNARKIETGTFILKPEETDIVAGLKDTLNDYSAQARTKDIDVKLDSIDQSISAKVDLIGFKRVVGNLLGNAIKFTPKGGAVNISARIENEELLVSIEDNGKGMEPAEVQKIFERYTRLSRHKGIEGSGIGLFVVKCIVHAHGGRVDVQSRVGEGTKFTVVFPLDPPVNERGELVSLDFE